MHIYTNKHIHTGLFNLIKDGVYPMHTQLTQSHTDGTSAASKIGAYVIKCLTL